jgi:exosome complex component MTR3
VVTILEADEDGWWGDDRGEKQGSGWGLLNVLAGCVTCASAAIVDAGIDCVDVPAGGVAALVKSGAKEVVRVLDPCPSEHKEIVAACVVGYLAGRDEITELWMKGDVGLNTEELIEGATHAALGNLSVLKEVLLEAVEAKFKGESPVEGGQKRKGPDENVEMEG